MAARSQFQLFPNPAQHNGPAGSQNKKPRIKRTTKSISTSTAAEDTSTDGRTEAVILKLIEDTKTVVTPLDRHTHSRSQTDTPRAAEAPKISNRPKQSQTTPLSQAPAVHSKRTPSPSVASNDNSQPQAHSASMSLSSLSSIAERAKRTGSTNHPKPPESVLSSPRARPAPASRTSPSARSETITPSTSPPTSDPPMRSIFTRYNAPPPTNQQNYYGQRFTTPKVPCEPLSSETHSVTTNRAAEHGPAQTNLGGGQHVASTQELERLWDAANGAGSRTGVGTVKLLLCRTDPLTYTLGSSSVPLYTLRSNSMNDIEIHRTHPTKLNTKAPVVTLSLGEVDQRNDESAAVTLFPKLAEIFARDQSLEYSRRNRLDPRLAMQAENEAVKRAQVQEACILQWNAAHSRYDLYHQALQKTCVSEGAGVTSPHRENLSGLLYLTIANPSSGYGISPLHPKILITALRRAEHQPAPSFPSETEVQLMELDLDTKTLSLSTDCIFSTVPSLFAIDALIATILTVTALDDAGSLVLKSMNIQELKAEQTASLPPTGPQENGPEAIQDNTNSSRDTNNIPEPVNQTRTVENDEETTLMSQLRSQPRTKKSKRRSSQPRKWSKPRFLSWRVEPTEQNTLRKKRQQIHSENYSMTSVQEIDLERQDRFRQPTPTADQNASKPRNGLFRPFIWVFSILLSGLTALIKFLVRVLVRLCVKDEKS